MSRIASRFQHLSSQRRRALVTFITAGDPQPSVTVPLMHALVEAGADIVELGVPFSDPMADGPVIQLASERALVHDVSLRDVLAMVKEFRTRDAQTPVVLVGYLNPIEAMGYDAMADAAVVAGVDGFIVVDMPPEEASQLHGALRARDLDMIFLLAPTSDEERIRLVCERASGFVYYVSLKGVTGAGNLDVDEVARKVRIIKGLCSLPVGVGFGIRDGDAAARIGAVSDAVVVGSALVSRVAERVDDPESIPGYVAELVADMRGAMDRAR